MEKDKSVTSNVNRKSLRIDRPVVFLPSPPLPHNMLMELANICNHNCLFCGYKDMKRKKTTCNKTLMLSIMKQAYDGGTREVGFYMIGEPFISPDLADYVSYAHNLGYEYIYLTTNGALATLDRMKELISAGLNSIKFSVNAGTKETYKIIHGNDDFETVKSNIIRLHDYVVKNEINLNVFLSFVKVNANRNDIESLYTEFNKYIDKIYIYKCSNQAGGMANLITNGIVEKEDWIAGSTAPCEMVFNRLHITSEGYLNLCCADVNGYLSAIDLHSTSLQEAWNSDIMIDMRRKHLSNELQGTLCYNCIYNTYEPIEPLNYRLLSF